MKLRVVLGAISLAIPTLIGFIVQLKIFRRYRAILRQSQLLSSPMTIQQLHSHIQNPSNSSNYLFKNLFIQGVTKSYQGSINSSFNKQQSYLSKIDYLKPITIFEYLFRKKHLNKPYPGYSNFQQSSSILKEQVYQFKLHDQVKEVYVNLQGNENLPFSLYKPINAQYYGSINNINNLDKDYLNSRKRLFSRFIFSLLTYGVQWNEYGIEFGGQMTIWGDFIYNQKNDIIRCCNVKLIGLKEDLIKHFKIQKGKLLGLFLLAFVGTILAFLAGYQTFKDMIRKQNIKKKENLRYQQSDYREKK